MPRELVIGRETSKDQQIMGKCSMSYIGNLKCGNMHKETRLNWHRTY